MIETLLGKIVAAFTVPLVVFSNWLTPIPELVEVPVYQEVPVYVDSGVDENLGVALPEVAAVFETSLAAPITAAATTMTLTSNAIRGGGAISGFTCFTIDEGSAQAEFICGTASGTAVTGLTRGISPADGITEDTDLQFAHRRGANVKITDFPVIQRLKSQNNGEGTFENPITYATGVTPVGTSDLTDVEYVLGAISGTSTLNFDKEIAAGTAGETVATGSVVYLNTADAEWYLADADLRNTYEDRTIGIAQGSGTNGNAINRGVLLSGLDTTRTGMTGGLLYFLSGTAGSITTATTSKFIGQARTSTAIYVNPGLLDTQIGRLTATNTWSGGNNTFTGQLTGHASTSYTLYTASTTWIKPANFEYIEVTLCAGGGGGGGGTNAATGGGGGGGGGCSFENLTAAELSGTTSVAIVVGVGGTAGNNLSGGTGAPSAFGGFLSATGGNGGSNADPGVQGTAGTGTGGDINWLASAGSNGGGIAGFGLGGSGGGNPFSATTYTCFVETGFASGATGLNCGGGGGGSCSGDSTADISGGAGAQGFVSIKVYY